MTLRVKTSDGCAICGQTTVAGVTGCLLLSGKVVLRFVRVEDLSSEE